MMFSTLTPFLLALLPLVSADVHRLKLKKLAPATSNPDLESLYLAEKYGGGLQPQLPLKGSRRIGRPSRKNDELFWTQEEAKGGHSVPLSSTFF